MNTRKNLGNNRSPKTVLKLLSKNMPPTKTPQELRGHAGKLPTSVKASKINNNRNLQSKSSESEDTLSISNFSALNFDVNSDEESLIFSRNQNIRRKLRRNRMEEANLILSDNNNSDVSLRGAPPTDKTYEELGLSLEPIDESLDMSNAKKEMQKKRNRRRTEVEVLNLTNVVSKFNEKFVNNNDNDYTQSFKDTLNIGSVSIEEDSINLDKENRQKKQFRKSRKSVHFDIDHAIYFQETDKESEGTEKTSTSLNSREGNVGNYNSEIPLQEIESHKSKETSIVSMIDNSLFSEDPSFNNNSLLHNDPNSKLKKFIGKRKKSITFDFDDIILKMKDKSPENTEQNNIQSLPESGEKQTANKSLTVENIIKNTTETSNPGKVINQAMSPVSVEKQLESSELGNEIPISVNRSKSYNFSNKSLIQHDSMQKSSKSESDYPSSFAGLDNALSPSTILQSNSHSSMLPKAYDNHLELLAKINKSSHLSPKSSASHVESGKLRRSKRLSSSSKFPGKLLELSVSDESNSVSSLKVVSKNFQSPNRKSRSLPLSPNHFDFESFLPRRGRSLSFSPTLYSELPKERSRLNLFSKFANKESEIHVTGTSTTVVPETSSSQNGNKRTSFSPNLSQRKLLKLPISTSKDNPISPKSDTLNKSNSVESIGNRQNISLNETENSSLSFSKIALSPGKNAYINVPTSSTISHKTSPDKYIQNVIEDMGYELTESGERNLENLDLPEKEFIHSFKASLGQKRELERIERSADSVEKRIKMNPTVIISRMSPRKSHRNFFIETSVSEEKINVTRTRSSPQMSPQKRQSSSSERDVNTPDKINATPTRSNLRISLKSLGKSFSERSVISTENTNQMTLTRSSPRLSPQKRHRNLSNDRPLNSADKMNATSTRSNQQISPMKMYGNSFSEESVIPAQKTINMTPTRSSPRISPQKRPGNSSREMPVNTAENIDLTPARNSPLKSPQEVYGKSSLINENRTIESVIPAQKTINMTPTRSSPRISPQKRPGNSSREMPVNTAENIDLTPTRNSPLKSPQEVDGKSSLINENRTIESVIPAQKTINMTPTRSSPLKSPQEVDGKSSLINENRTIESVIPAQKTINMTPTRSSPLKSPQEVDGKSSLINENRTIESVIPAQKTINMTPTRSSPRISPQKRPGNSSREMPVNTAENIDLTPTRNSPLKSPQEVYGISSLINENRTIESVIPAQKTINMTPTRSSPLKSPQEVDGKSSLINENRTIESVIPAQKTINMTPTRSSPRISPQKRPGNSSREMPVNTAENIDLTPTRNSPLKSPQEAYGKSSFINENRTILDETGIKNKIQRLNDESLALKDFHVQTSLSTSKPESNREINSVRLNKSNTGINEGDSVNKAVQSIGAVNRNRRGNTIKRSSKPSTSKSTGDKNKQLTLSEFLERLKTNQNLQKSDSNVLQEMIKKPKIVCEINAELEKKKKQEPPKKRKRTQTKTNLPPRMNNAIFQHFLKHKLSKEGSNVLQETVDLFFESLTNDLCVALASTKDSFIGKYHIYLLMKSLKIISNWDDLYALTQELLPANEWKKLVPIAYAHNKIYPQL